MSLTTLPPTRQALLRELKRAGEARAETLAERLGITVSAVRQQLSALHGDGLVSWREERSGPGRPKHVWTLAPAGEALFPHAYDELSNELLDGVAAEDPDLVDRLFARRRERRIDQAGARLTGLDPAARVAELARILDEDGYVATWLTQADGSFLVVEQHCAIFAVARRYRHACSSEIEFIRAVLPEASVERVSHIVEGATRCAYEIRPRPHGTVG
jgi:DeoR family transcriptional regulator, suf operon transcriptional repressor